MSIVVYAVIRQSMYSDLGSLMMVSSQFAKSMFLVSDPIKYAAFAALLP